jgi:hypothetical protein
MPEIIYPEDPKRSDKRGFSQDHAPLGDEAKRTLLVGWGSALIMLCLSFLLHWPFLWFLTGTLGVMMVMRGFWPRLFARYIEARLIEGVPAQRSESPIKWALATLFCLIVSAGGTALYRYLIAEPPTLQEIADFSSTRILALGIQGYPEGMMRDVVGTAFWINTDGWAATCPDSIRRGGANLYVSPEIDPATSSLNGHPVFESNGSFPLQVDHSATLEGVSILFVPIVNRESVKEFGQFEVSDFELSLENPKVGETVFIYGAEDGMFPRFTALKGSIESIGPVPDAMMGAVVDVPYKETYCGSPVIGADKKVIGMVVGKTSDGGTEVMWSSFISNLVDRLSWKK